jgi:tripartite ATP-independent transporter DctM subunit
MIVYAFMAGPSVSVGGMFMAGVVPGILITIGFMLLCSWITKKRGWATTGEPFQFKRLFIELRRSAIVLFMPIIIIGGIIGGAFTATEGSAISVIYALILGFFITRTLKISDLPRILVRAAITTAVVGALIAFASVITYLMTVDLMPQKLSALLFSLTKDPLVYLILVALLLFVVGMFLESNSAYIMLVPLLHPIALQYGIDPLHFGFLFVLNLVIGMLTPPVGVVLFVVCGVTGIRMRELVANIWPFVALMYAVLFLCMFFPAIVTTLPRSMGY